MGQSDPVLEDEVKYRYYTIIQLYRRATLQDNAQRYLLGTTCPSAHMAVSSFSSVNRSIFICFYELLLFSLVLDMIRDGLKAVTPYLVLEYILFLLWSLPSPSLLFCFLY
jgi:hypothetical protein